MGPSLAAANAWPVTEWIQRTHIPVGPALREVAGMDSVVKKLKQRSCRFSSGSHREIITAPITVRAHPGTRQAESKP